MNIIFYYFYKKGLFSSAFKTNLSFKNRLVSLIISILIMLFYVFFITNSDAEWSKNRYNNEISKAETLTIPVAG